MKWPLFRLGGSREPAQPKAPSALGLVLGGGSVRGAAHLGVLSVLEREGIVPVVVAGTSVGAVVGAGVAAGVSSEEMMRHFRAARWKDLARPSWGSKLSMLDSNPLGELVAKITSAETFTDLHLPMAVVASDILTGKHVVMTEGSLSEAVVASAAIPAIFEPVRREGALLVDGALTDNLPVRAARDLGADYVLAVDIMPPLDGSYEPVDIRDVLLLSLNIVQHESEIGRGDADLVITPDVVRVSMSDFSQVQQAYDAGVAAAEAALPTLLHDLGR